MALFDIFFSFLTKQLCLEAFGYVEIWFKVIKTNDLLLPTNFDIDFFCKGCEIVIEADHFAQLYRLLTLLYSYSELFDGMIRTKLFGEMLLKKFFFKLFLHWDDNVRNTYQQIIVFKVNKCEKLRIWGHLPVLKKCV